MNTLDVIRKLTEVICVSGYENTSCILNTLETILERKLQRYGTNYITKLGEGKTRILLTAHIDEVGFILTKHIGNKSYRIISIGNINPEALQNKLLEFKDYITGKVVKSNKVRVNGNSSFSDIVISFEEDIEIMSVGSFQRKYSALPGEIIRSPALDNRVSCTSLSMLYRRLTKRNITDTTVYFAFVGREETGANGFTELLKIVNPDYVIDIDSAYAKPIKNTKERKNWVIPVIGKGPAVQLIGKDFILDSTFRKIIEDTSLDNNIPLQYEVVDLQSGGTNARNTILNGYNPIQLNIPVRYQHEPYSEASIYDIDQMSNLLEKLIDRLPS